jgi:N4-gp56 family major capsid protein
MAVTNYPINHPLAVKVWAAKLFQESLKATSFYQFMGEDTNSIIQIKNELTKSAGDLITVGLRMQLVNYGVLGDATLEGNEESLALYSDSITINQLRNAVKNQGRMSDQRVTFSTREEARMGLTDWMANTLDYWVANQLTGNTAETDVRRTGLNSTIAFDDKHVQYGGTATTEAGVAAQGASAKFTIDLIDKCVTKAKTLTPMIRPIRHNGNDCYAIFLHPYQIRDLRTSTMTGQWLDIQKAAMTGGMVKDNPIFSGALGMYNNTYIYENSRLPSVVPNVRRAVFCGAQAGMMAFGRGSSAGSMRWDEETFDFGNQFGVAVGLIGGMKKTRFDNQDFGTIVVPTYAVE